MTATLIPIHPEAVPGRPDQLRWRVPRELFAVGGDAVAVPGLLDDPSPVIAVEVSPGAILTTLAPGRSWQQDGPWVRTTLHAALQTPGDWLLDPDAGSDPDAALEVEVSAALAGPAGAVVRSHGGTVEVVSVCDGVVSVRLGGACDGCPALGFTVGARLTTELRRACPSVREVRTAA